MNGAGTGELLYRDDDLLAALRRCHDADLPVAIHAIGDAAIDQVLRQLERFAGEDGALPRGWATVEHAEFIDATMLDRAVGLSE